MRDGGWTVSASWRITTTDKPRDGRDCLVEIGPAADPLRAAGCSKSVTSGGGGSPSVTLLEPEARQWGLLNGEPSCCALAGRGVLQRATPLSEVTHSNKDGPALPHPAGTIRKKSDCRM